MALLKILRKLYGWVNIKKGRIRNLGGNFVNVFVFLYGFFQVRLFRVQV